ncbi:hypothetical protein [Labrenzia sp. 5N]|uniref:hypothetical protein n=1 Tax=Labrenzia sp. 5N TaxID=2723402 RepID=UPI001444B525|nr:hypothetical protein [Labrenzia sp. 5N]
MAVTENSGDPKSRFDADIKRWELGFSEIEAIRKRGNDTHIAFRNYSVAFSQLALRSAFLMNGGAMFAGLAFLGALSRASDDNTYLTGFIVACACFVVGIIAAAAAALSAYLNYESHSLREQYETKRDALSKSVSHFPDLYVDQQQAVDADNSNWNAEIIKHEKIIIDTQKWAVGFGVTSFILFMIGCVVVGGTMATA